jgi:hypothetical protein
MEKLMSSVMPAECAASLGIERFLLMFIQSWPGQKPTISENFIKVFVELCLRRRRTGVEEEAVTICNAFVKENQV